MIEKLLAWNHFVGSKWFHIDRTFKELKDGTVCAL